MTNLSRINSFKNEHFNNLITAATAGKTILSDGSWQALRSYLCTNDRDYSTFTVEDAPWDRDFADFIQTVEDAGITEFILADESTALMRTLHRLLTAGWIIADTSTQPQKYGEDKQGLRIKKA